MITIIKKIYSQDCIYIPIEIILYNIINLSPSPLNSDIIIDLNSSCSQDETFGNLKDGLISSKKNSDKNGVSRKNNISSKGQIQISI